MMKHAALLIALVFALPAMGEQDATEIQRLSAENQALRQQVAELEARLKQLETKSEDLAAEKQQLEQLAGITVSGEAVESKRALIESKFDKKSQRTVVRSKPEKLAITHGSRADHWFSVAYSFPGETQAGPPEKLTAFIQTTGSGGVYNATTPLVLDLGGEEPMTLTPASYSSIHKRSSTGATASTRKDNETLIYEFTWEQARILARSLEVTGTLGNTRIKITPEIQADIKALYQRGELSADTAAE